MALKHELCSASTGIPELHAAILRAGEHPVSIGCQGDRENKIPVAFERFNALATLGLYTGTATWASQFPHLDGSVQ